MIPIRLKHLVTFNDPDAPHPGVHTLVTRANENMVTGGSPGRMKELVDLLTGVEIEENEYRGLVVVHGRYEGIDVSGFSSGMATGSVSCVMPEIIEARSADDLALIRCGTAGGYAGTDVGDLIISTRILHWDSAAYSVIRGFRHALGHALFGLPTSEKMKKLTEQALKVHGGSKLAFLKDAVSRVGVVPLLLNAGYRPEADYELIVALAKTAESHIMDFQEVHISPTNVTPEIYINTILGEYVAGKGSKGVSMEMSLICAERDFYAAFAGVDMKVGNLLRVVDLPYGESQRKNITAEDHAEMERRQLVTALDALVAYRSSHG